MIGSDLEGADLESRAAGWAASVISDDAAAVRTVIEAYGDRATSQATITIRAVGETLPARLRQLFVLERTGVTGRSRSTCASRCRSSQEGAAPASAGPPRGSGPIGCAGVYLPVQGPGRSTSAQCTLRDSWRFHPGFTRRPGAYSGRLGGRLLPLA